MIGVALGAVLVSGSPAWAADDASPVRVSISNDGPQGNGPSRWPSISADGSLIAFSSAASNLLPDDFGTGERVLLKNVATGELTRVAYGRLPAISGDGRHVSFITSSALVPGDTNRLADVYVRDLQEGSTTLASVATDGTLANAAITDAAISADGRFVVFTSTATTLTPGATATYKKVFVHDRETATTTEVSVRPNGLSGTGGDSMLASISADGRYVAFSSRAKDLVAARPLAGHTHAYVRDLVTGSTHRLTSNYVRGTVSISADGRYIAFYDEDDSLAPGDPSGNRDTYRVDVTTNEITRVNVATDGTPANADGGFVPQAVPLSADGRFVLFESDATNLVPDDTNNRRDVFLRDTVAGTTARVSVDGEGAESAGNYVGAISADGTAVAYWSEVPQEAADTNPYADVYLSRR